MHRYSADPLRQLSRGQASPLTAAAAARRPVSSSMASPDRMASASEDRNGVGATGPSAMRHQTIRPDSTLRTTAQFSVGRARAFLWANRWNEDPVPPAPGGRKTVVTNSLVLSIRLSPTL